MLKRYDARKFVQIIFGNGTLAFQDLHEEFQVGCYLQVFNTSLITIVMVIFIYNNDLYVRYVSV